MQVTSLTLSDMIFLIDNASYFVVLVPLFPIQCYTVILFIFPI